MKKTCYIPKYFYIIAICSIIINCIIIDIIAYLTLNKLQFILTSISIVSFAVAFFASLSCFKPNKSEMAKLIPADIYTKNNEKGFEDIFKIVKDIIATDFNKFYTEENEKRKSDLKEHLHNEGIRISKEYWQMHKEYCQQCEYKLNNTPE